MGQLTVISFITLDGVVEDPDASSGTAFGGWALRQGRAAIAGDKFRLGPLLDTATLLFGRRTWEHFSTLWPARDDPFSTQMNQARKAVATSRPLDTSAWSNSRVIDGPVEDWVRQTVPGTDVIVIGSVSVVRSLIRAGLVDEYRLFTFPDAVGDGQRLFAEPVALRQVSSVPSPYGVLTTLRPDDRSRSAS